MLSPEPYHHQRGRRDIAHVLLIGQDVRARQSLGSGGSRAWSSAGVWLALPVAGVVLLGVIHMSTVWLQVPRHAELNEGYDEVTLRRLVLSNWVRTVGWSVRCALAVAMVLVAS